MMENKIIFFKTNELSAELVEQYCISFNEIFEKEFTPDYFMEKYCGNELGYSFHAFQLNELNEVKGSCSIMPSTYLVQKEKIRIGTMVDVFIKKDSRGNPYLLRDLFLKIINSVEENKIQAVLAIPNKNAFNYWTRIVKFKTIGYLDYFIFPLYINQIGFFNHLFKLYLKLSIFAFKCIPSIPKPLAVSRLFSVNYLKSRFSSQHSSLKNEGDIIHFLVMKERKYKVAYLINLGRKRKENFIKMLLKLSNIKNINFIVYIGRLPFFQCSLIKIPKKYHPQALPLCLKVIDENIKDEQIKILYEFNNWDFSLINFDTR